MKKGCGRLALSSPKMAERASGEKGDYCAGCCQLPEVEQWCSLREEESWWGQGEEGEGWKPEDQAQGWALLWGQIWSQFRSPKFCGPLVPACPSQSLISSTRATRKPGTFWINPSSANGRRLKLPWGSLCLEPHSFPAGNHENWKVLGSVVLIQSWPCNLLSFPLISSVNRTLWGSWKD